MNRILRKMLNAAGMDRAIWYSILARGIGVAIKPINIYLFALFLSERERGYYFTFMSVLGLTMFLNLGLTGVLQIFASHEKSRLEWGKGGVLHGDEEAQRRLRSLLRLGVIWFGIAAVLVMILLYPAGIAFFSRGNPDDRSLWMLPWFWAIVVTAGSLFLGPIFSILEGCGRVKEVRMLGVLQPLFSYPVMWMTLILGGGLLAGPVLFGSGLVISVIWLFRTHYGFLKQNISLKRQGSLDWREIWPLQWRTAVGWASGYLTYELFAPMTFVFVGPEDAGRMGMSLFTISQVGAMSMMWIDTKRPQLAMHWASKEYTLLDMLFAKAFLRMLLLSVGSYLAVYLLILFLGRLQSDFANLFLSPSVFCKMMVIQLLNNIIMSQKIYLTANKNDPLVVVSVLQGVLIMVSNWYLGRWFGMVGMVNGSLVAAGLACISCTLICMRSRRKWQKEEVKS